MCARACAWCAEGMGLLDVFKKKKKRKRKRTGEDGEDETPTKKQKREQPRGKGKKKKKKKRKKVSRVTTAEARRARGEWIEKAYSPDYRQSARKRKEEELKWNTAYNA